MAGAIGRGGEQLQMPRARLQRPEGLTGRGEPRRGIQAQFHGPGDDPGVRVRGDDQPGARDGRCIDHFGAEHGSCAARHVGPEGLAHASDADQGFGRVERNFDPEHASLLEGLGVV